jgi:flagellar biosynthesis/type III secretory pathway protein FliH
MISTNPVCYSFPDISSDPALRRVQRDAAPSEFRRMPAAASGGGRPSARVFIRGGGSPGDEQTATLEEIEQKAYCRGFADGEKKGFDEGQRSGSDATQSRLEPLFESLERVLSELNSLRRQTCLELEAELVQLAIGVARKIVGREVSADPDHIAGVLRKALRLVENAAPIRIRLNPSDLKHLEGTRPRMLSELAEARRACFEADAALAPGGCSIETDSGDVDARIEHQLQVVEDAFRIERSQNARQEG